MEVDWLEDFLALSSVGVFSKAAESRNISQSAFTRRIKNLEYWIGAPLFNRSIHPVTLTEAGKSFQPIANEVVKTLEFARAEVRGMVRREDEVLEFVALHTLAISYYPSLISRMIAAIGPLKSRVVAHNFSGCVETMLAGSSDFMLCYHHHSVPIISDDIRYPSMKIAEDKIVAVSAPDEYGKPKYGLNGGSVVPLLSYPLDSFLGKITSQILKRANLNCGLEPIYENSVCEALKTACIEGMGIAWLPMAAIRNDIDNCRLIRISTDDLEQVIGIYLYRSLQRSRREMERFWSVVSGLKCDPVA